MQQMFTGRIVSSELSNIGGNRFLFGYLTIETTDSTKLKFKVDSDTSCDTVEVGEEVVIDGFTVGNGGLWIIKNIKKVQIYEDRKFKISNEST